MRRLQVRRQVRVLYDWAHFGLAFSDEEELAAEGGALARADDTCCKETFDEQVCCWANIRRRPLRTRGLDLRPKSDFIFPLIGDRAKVKFRVEGLYCGRDS